MARAIGHIGVCLTTLTSALSYLLGAPRVLQAIARDSDYWILQYLGKGSGPNGEPLRALLLTWAIAQLILIFGAGFINALAYIVTALFLLTFCLINLLAFLSALIRNGPTDYAPTFQWNSRWLALLGFILSVLTMACALASSSSSSAEGTAIAVAMCAFLLLLLFWYRHALLALVTTSASRCGIVRISQARCRTASSVSRRASSLRAEGRRAQRRRHLRSG